MVTKGNVTCVKAGAHLEDRDLSVADFGQPLVPLKATKTLFECEEALFQCC